VLDVAMRVGGGAAFRRDIGIERHFRDARAAAVMAPTSDALREFIGRALCGLPLFG
jgi:alkylation response protein AidB-like acyl-CoA dehydrogenase